MPESVIRVFRPFFPETAAIATYMERAAHNGQFANGGPLVTSLEERLADHFGVAPEHVAMCTSGTTALEGALATTGDQGAEWELPAWTFTATPGAALRSGKTPRFVDVDNEQRANFGAGSARGVDVLPFGASPSWNRPAVPATVLVDAAASFDASKNFPFPPHTTVGVIVSLHATKSLPAGEGGVFFSNDKRWVDEFRRWANFGMWGSRVSQVAGTNGKMSELTAAVAHAALDAWPGSRDKWLKLGEISHGISANLGLLPSGGDALGLATPYWNIQLRNEQSRMGLESYLSDQGVETRRWWGDGCHTMPAYQGIAHDALSKTDEFARTFLGLPFHLGLSSADFDRIERSLRTYLDGPS